MVRKIAKLLCTALLAGTAFSAGAFNLSLDVVFTDSNYQATGSDSFSDLLAAHNAANIISDTSVLALDGVDTSVYAGNISGDYSVLMTATLDINLAGSYEFQVGTDWGRGGGVALFDTASNTQLEEYVTSSDIWWANSWSNSDVISTTYEFTENQYTIMWLGFEGCCAGSSTIRFAYEGGAFQTASMTNLAPHVVPLPASIYLLGAAIFGMSITRRTSRRVKQAI